MSLFKVRDIWSLDLEELQRHCGDARPTSSPTSGKLGDGSASGDSDRKAQFIASIGQWSCIGDQDVFVCGDLRGHLYIIQVPESDQRKHIGARATWRQKASASGGGSREQETSQDERQERASADVSERQILAAHELNAPLVDLKCGFFTSSLKQSVGALTPDQLILLQVARNQVDLLSAANLDDASPMGGPRTIDKNLLSHKFEVYIKFELLAGQFAYNLLVLNSHADSSLVDVDSGPRDAADAWPTPASLSSQETKFKRTSKRIVQQLRLPQRDKIIVQYADQFLFTLIDSKKLIGHFYVGPPLAQATRGPPQAPQSPRANGRDEDSSVVGLEAAAAAAAAAADDDDDNRERCLIDQRDLKLKQMERTVGCMPMAHVAIDKSSSALIFSFSDRCIHSLALDKLIKPARQNVMKRVALDLLGAREGSSKLSLAREQLRASQHGPDWDELVHVDLDASADWSREVPGPPIAMQGLVRQVKAAAGGGAGPGAGVAVPGAQTTHQQQSSGQLLVMSRYNLDLFSHSGAHLWSQHFETPLICMHAYTTARELSPSALASGPAEAQAHAAALASEPAPDQQQFTDKIVTLLCSDNLSDDKTNLTIMSDDQVGWSALLNSKPLSVWRVNLSQMPGMLATLDLMGDQLIVSYLGTNPEPADELAAQLTEGDSAEYGAAGTSGEARQLVVELERLDEGVLEERATRDIDDESRAQRTEQGLRPRLCVTNSLQAATGAARDPAANPVDVCTSITVDPSSTGAAVIHNLVVTFEHDDLLRLQPGAQLADVSYPARGVARVQLGSFWPDRREPINLETTFSLLSCATSHGVGVAAIDNFSEISGFHEAESPRVLPKTLKVIQYFDYNETHSGTLREQRAFLLPLSIIADLVHIDYSLGQAQELEDVLNNLPNYWPDGSHFPATPSHFCDLSLELRCTFMALLGELVADDLMCHERKIVHGCTVSGHSHDSSWRAPATDTLESIDRLAKSLDWRLGFISSGLARQASEDSGQPVMVSLALKLKLNKLTCDPKGLLDKLDEQIVWLHVCDCSPASRSKLVDDFVRRHMREWTRCDASGSGGGAREATDTTASSAPSGRSMALVSIECNQPLPVVLVLHHMFERLKHLVATDTKLGPEIVTNTSANFSNQSLDALNNGNRLGVSLKLHEALVGLNEAHDSEHKIKFQQLKGELASEFCKFQVAAKASLSMAKRLPSLPDEMGEQVTGLVTLVRTYNQKLMNILDQLDKLKKLDFAYSKLPEARMLKIKSPRATNEMSWSGFEPIID